MATYFLLKGYHYPDFHHHQFCVFWSLYPWNHLVCSLCLILYLWNVSILLHVAVVYWFSLLCSIPWYKRSTIFLSIPLLMVIWVFLQFGAITNNVTTNIPCRSLGGHMWTCCWVLYYLSNATWQTSSELSVLNNNPLLSPWFRRMGVGQFLLMVSPVVAVSCQLGLKTPEVTAGMGLRSCCLSTWGLSSCPWTCPWGWVAHH